MPQNHDESPRSRAAAAAEAAAAKLANDSGEDRIQGHRIQGQSAPDHGTRRHRALDRRAFVAGLLGATTLATRVPAIATRKPSDDTDAAAAAPPLPAPTPDEDIFRYLRRVTGSYDADLYRRILGSANEYKEGDVTLGVAAADADSRAHARSLLGRTTIGDLLAHPIFEDELSRYIATAVDAESTAHTAAWTVGELAQFLLASNEQEIAAILPGLPSDVVGCVVKLLDNDQLIAVSCKIFHPLPGSRVGAPGYLGARIQPNSPTDNVEDIVWQVLCGFSYAVGDVVLGTNPVSSEPDSVHAIEIALAEVLETFGLTQTMPHCVLAHIDVQAEVERRKPGSTALWFQSLAGVEAANSTFDISVQSMREHARSRRGHYGLYFETGQGADATNGHGEGFDMVLHEARKYGFARALSEEVRKARVSAGLSTAAWVHLNDVAGFIGPEVFRTREQLVRCCLEDTVMGKLHGLTIGLDICSTLHMEVDLDDLDWCIDQVMPANPAYLMALPTKNDPMLSYLTTGFHDHVRIREKFGYKVDDTMWSFYQELGVIDAEGRPTERFGQPTWVYLHYRRRRGDQRTDEQILAEGREQMAAVRARGVELAEGHGATIADLEPELDAKLRRLYLDSKRCIWSELPSDFVSSMPGAIGVRTSAANRTDYVLHPPGGEVLEEHGMAIVTGLAEQRRGRHDVQLVLSDGLNPLSLTDDGHLQPYLQRLSRELREHGFDLAPESLVVTGGRVRAGYRIGELLYGGGTREVAATSATEARPAILHVIGERPGSGHHAFSVYLTAAPPAVWARPGEADHNISKVISGIADTALDPAEAAVGTVRLLREMTAS